MKDFIWGIKNEPWKTYEPSNGSEGSAFMSHFCENCIFDEESDCEIIAASMIFKSNEPEYPKEFVYNENGNPSCTAFQQLSNEGK
jgi:hypothetical protein